MAKIRRGTPTGAFHTICGRKRINPIAFLAELERSARIRRPHESVHYIEIEEKMTKLPKKDFFREVLKQHLQVFGKNAVEQYDGILQPGVREHKKTGNGRKRRLRPGETLIRSKPPLIILGAVKTVSIGRRTAAAAKAKSTGALKERILIYAPQKGERAAQPLYSISRAVTRGGKRWGLIIGYNIYDYTRKRKYNLLAEKRASGIPKQLINILKTFRF